MSEQFVNISSTHLRGGELFSAAVCSGNEIMGCGREIPCAAIFHTATMNTPEQLIEMSQTGLCDDAVERFALGVDINVQAA